MDIKDYSEFTPTTALYPKENEFNYLKLGLKSEAGELIGKVAKLYRGDKDFDGMKPQIISELGDICWFISQFNNRTKIFQFKPDVKSFYQAENNVDNISFINLTSDNIYNICRDIFLPGNFSPTGEDPVVQDDVRVKYTTAHLCSEVWSLAIALGVTIEDCFDDNYEKLTGRQVRGTIKGNGDIR